MRTVTEMNEEPQLLILDDVLVNTEPVREERTKMRIDKLNLKVKCCGRGSV